MGRSALSILLLTAHIAAAGTVLAQEAGQVTLETTIQKEVVTVNDKGERQVSLVEAVNAVPGDELLFTISYTNEGGEAAENVVIVNPLPEATSYVADTAAGEGTRISFSVDGGGTFDRPENLWVQGVDGQRKPALPEDYTHIRWRREGPLPPGGGGSVQFRARLK